MAAAQDAGSLEVFSWWTSPGEAPALQALFDAYSAAYPDVEIINAAVAGGAGVNAIAVLQTRLQGNQPRGIRASIMLPVRHSASGAP